MQTTTPCRVRCSAWLADILPSLSSRQLKERTNSLRLALALLANRGKPESLISNECPSPTDVTSDSLPRRQIITRRCSKCVTNSMQSSPAMWTRRSVVQRLVTVSDTTMSRSLEDSPRRNTNEWRCQLALHTVRSRLRLKSSATRPSGRYDCKPRRHAGFAAAHG